MLLDMKLRVLQGGKLAATVTPPIGGQLTLLFRQRVAALEEPRDPRLPLRLIEGGRTRPEGVEGEQ